MAHRDHFKDALVTVPDGQDGEDAVARGQVKREKARLGKHVVVTKHHPLRLAGRSRGVDNGEEVLALDVGKPLLDDPITGRTQVASALEQIGQLVHRTALGRLTLKENNMLNFWQGAADREHPLQDGLVLGNQEHRVAVGHDEGNLLFGGVRRARHVGRAAKQNRRIAEHPFRTVVGDNGHMLAGLQPEPDKGRTQGARRVIKLAVAAG